MPGPQGLQRHVVARHAARGAHRVLAHGAVVTEDEAAQVQRARLDHMKSSICIDYKGYDMS